ncbi:hypothetical protein Hanom_Chr15g01414821 [Helianthus anomalus]
MQNPRSYKDGPAQDLWIKAVGIVQGSGNIRRPKYIVWVVIFPFIMLLKNSCSSTAGLSLI